MKSNLCLNCKDDELETRIHIFQTCPTTKELLTFLERILTRAEHLQLGNKRYLFLYERYKVNAIENMLLIFQMRFIYCCKFNNVPVNKVTFNCIMAKRSQKGLKKASEIALLLNKELEIQAEIDVYNLEKIHD